MKILCFLLPLFFLLSSCKKGEDDPEFSFYTRKARLSNEWHMKTGSGSFTKAPYNDLYTFNGNALKDVYGRTIGNYLLSLTVKKDGTFSISEVYPAGVLMGSGTWAFNSGSGELKKKEEVIFYLDELSKGATWNNGFFTQSSATFAYKIKELRNNKLVLYSSGIYYAADGGVVTFQVDYTFEP
jgi:hypothetical protein